MAGVVGDEPPFHTPVFVMTHHVRPSFTLSDTTFHFADRYHHEVVPSPSGVTHHLFWRR